MQLLAGEAPDRLICVVTVLGIVCKPFVRMKARIGAEEHHARHGSAYKGTSPVFALTQKGRGERREMATPKTVLIEKAVAVIA